jgi:serine/threonine protein kinase
MFPYSLDTRPDNISLTGRCNGCRWEKVPDNDGGFQPLYGRYKITSVLKNGGMGCVFKGEDTLKGDMVAIKRIIINSDSSEDDQVAMRGIHNEADILSRIDFEGIPKIRDFFIIHDFETNDSAHYLVMSYIDGKELDTIIKEKKGLIFSAEETETYLTELLKILEKLHSADPPIIYRDIKPANIMIGVKKDSVSLVDFGIAKLTSARPPGKITGTPGYAPPELYNGKANERSDLYSLGTVMHYLLTGIAPEDSTRPPFTFEQIKDINPMVPDYLNDIVMSMLEFEEENRPLSAGEVLEMLQNKEFTLSSDGKNRRYYSRRRSRGFRASIHSAAYTGDENNVRYYINSGVDINIKDSYGMTPLHRAAETGQVRIVKLLIKLGADLEAVDNFHETPLHTAAKTKNRKCIKALIKGGAKVNTRNSAGWTPCTTAKYHLAGPEIVELFRKQGAEEVTGLQIILSIPMYIAAKVRCFMKDKI